MEVLYDKKSVVETLIQYRVDEHIGTININVSCKVRKNIMLKK